MTRNPNKPFVGKMKDQKTGYESGRSLRAIIRGAVKKREHIGMIPQFIPEIEVVGATLRKQKYGNRKLTGGKDVVVGGKTIWHDAAVIKAKKK